MSRRAIEAGDTQILISPRIFGELSLKGFNRAVPAYNVVGIRADGAQ